MSNFDQSDPNKSAPKSSSFPHMKSHEMSQEQKEKANTMIDKMAQGIERVKDTLGSNEALERAEESLMDKKADINKEPAINESLRREYRHHGQEGQSSEFQGAAPAEQLQESLKSKSQTSEDLPENLTHENPAMIF